MIGGCSSTHYGYRNTSVADRQGVSPANAQAQQLTNPTARLDIFAPTAPTDPNGKIQSFIQGHPILVLSEFLCSNMFRVFKFNGFQDDFNGVLRCRETADSLVSKASRSCSPRVVEPSHETSKPTRLKETCAANVLWAGVPLRARCQFAWFHWVNSLTQL